MTFLLEAPTGTIELLPRDFDELMGEEFRCFQQQLLADKLGWGSNS